MTAMVFGITIVYDQSDELDPSEGMKTVERDHVY